MDRLQIAVLLTSLVDRLRELGAWCGETQVQKSVYVAQEVGRVPLGFDFILYKHGPYSFDLRDELTSLRADGQLRLEPQRVPYGPRFVATDNARVLRGRFPKTTAKYVGALSFVAQNLASMQIDELERMTTALYASLKRPDDDRYALANWINERKPHVSVEEALDALTEARRLTSSFQQVAAR